MKSVNLVILFIFTVAWFANSEDNTSERCLKLTRFATAVFEEMKSFDDYEDTMDMYQRLLNMDLTDPAVREKILCKLAGAKTLHEVYAALPKVKYFTFESLLDEYRRIRRRLAVHDGGYTNMHRLLKLNEDFNQWLSQLGKGPYLTDVTDLPTLTHFLEVMQVKYGSRWMSYLAYLRHQGLLIENPKEFAQKIYVKDSAEVLANLTGLNLEDSSYIVYKLSGHGSAYYPEPGWAKVSRDIIMFLGDMGYLNIPE